MDAEEMDTVASSDNNQNEGDMDNAIRVEGN